jgi:hypothetical protein
MLVCSSVVQSYLVRGSRQKLTDFFQIPTVLQDAYTGLAKHVELGSKQTTVIRSGKRVAATTKLQPQTGWQGLLIREPGGLRKVSACNLSWCSNDVAWPQGLLRGW